MKNETAGRPLERRYQLTAVHIEGNDSNYWLRLYISRASYKKREKKKDAWIN